MKRRTRQQDVIKSLFSKVMQPMTAARVFELAQEDFPGIGQATVYRQIQQALEEGLIRVVDLPGKSAHYELSSRAHGHFFICRKCQSMLPLSGCPGKLCDLAPKGCEVTSHEIFLYGLCPCCVKDESSRAKLNLVV